MNAITSVPLSTVSQALPLGPAVRSTRVVVSWTAAGGVTAGGILVGLAALDAPEMAQALLPLAPVLFVAGALGGMIHGSILAFVGRPEGVGGSVALVAIGLGALASVPALLVAWVATAWISLTSAVLALNARTATVMALVGWVAGAVICGWAAWEGWRAFRSAFARWPESRPGTLLLAVAAGTFAVAFVRGHPEIWWTDYRVTGVGALLLALAATLWIALPIIVVGLHLVHRRFARLWAVGGPEG